MVAILGRKDLAGRDANLTSGADLQHSKWICDRSDIEPNVAAMPEHDSRG